MFIKNLSTRLNTLSASLPKTATYRMHKKKNIFSYLWHSNNQ